MQEHISFHIEGTERLHLTHTETTHTKTVLPRSVTVYAIRRHYQDVKGRLLDTSIKDNVAALSAGFPNEAFCGTIQSDLALARYLEILMDLFED